MLPDIKPSTERASLEREAHLCDAGEYSIDIVAEIVGMSNAFIRRVVGRKSRLTGSDILSLLDQDSFKETYVPRSRVLAAVKLKEQEKKSDNPPSLIENPSNCELLKGDAKDLIRRIKKDSVQCVVTSTPYWGMRIYNEFINTEWADGDCCPFGHEQTPEAFIRHTVEVLSLLKDVISEDGSIWWNVMDTYNTRTQIRSNASEALKAMQGLDRRKWSDHACRRYSAGHSYLKDGEQCCIPFGIAERASRIGLYVKSVITWVKPSNLPEPQESRVSRSTEYIIHLTKTRTPKFNKHAYLKTCPDLGGKSDLESDKLCDAWLLQTSSGRDGHGAQFPLSLPGRCISLSTDKGDLVLDPFNGSGNSMLAAMRLGRRFLGFDISEEYLEISRRRLDKEANTRSLEPGLLERVSTSQLHLDVA